MNIHTVARHFRNERVVFGVANGVMVPCGISLPAAVSSLNNTTPERLSFQNKPISSKRQKAKTIKYCKLQPTHKSYRHC
jgi:hypothetical protein